MKTINVSEATNVQLDWLMTSIETPDELRYGVQDWREQRCSTKSGEFKHRWTQNWSMTGPLIECRGIALRMSFTNSGKRDGWTAHIFDGTNTTFAEGADPLVAACRCMVVVDIGETAEIPEELA
jgi:hypothetical protein